MMLLTKTLGADVVSKASAEKLGSVDGAVIDSTRRTISALRIGKGRKARFVSWEHVTGVGTGGVVVDSDDALREPTEGVEERSADGSIAIIGGLVLSDSGNAHGEVADVEYDADTGVIESIHTSQPTPLDADRLVAVGTYAWIVSAGDDEATPAL